PPSSSLLLPPGPRPCPSPTLFRSLLLGIGWLVSGAPSPLGPRVGPAYVPVSRPGLSPRSVRGDAMELAAGRSGRRVGARGGRHRSEEHTSALQSREELVWRPLLAQ